MLGAALEFSSFLASPIGVALVISSGCFCFVAAQAHQRVQQRLDACRQRLEQLTGEHQLLARHLVERRSHGSEDRQGRGLETLGEAGRWQ